MTARSLLGPVERWFTAPEPGAAGRMGVFRILYGLMYLWYLSIFDLSILAGMPADYRSTPIALLDGVATPSAGQLRMIDSLLVAALVLLILGLHTRIVTAAVLVGGLLREGLMSGIHVEHGSLFLVFYIPLFFLVAGRWGDTHGLDARRGARAAGGADDRVVDPTDSSWPHFLAARGLLVMLALLFTMSPLYKSFRGGTWLSDHRLLADLSLVRNLELTELSLPNNPVAPWLAEHAGVAFGLQLAVLAFEGLFFLALLHRHLRSWFVATALVFHAFNALFLVVTFTPILIVYALFVDWESLLRRARARLPRLRAPEVPRQVATAGALLAAGLIALTWRAGSYAAFNLGGWLDWRTMWLPVLPVAVAASVVSTARLVGEAPAWWRRVRSMPASAAAADLAGGSSAS